MKWLFMERNLLCVRVVFVKEVVESYVDITFWH